MHNKTNVTCLLLDPDTVKCDGHFFHREELLNASEGLFWGYLTLFICLVLFAGLMSGLTMGLLSLDIMTLEVLKRGGKPREKKYAKRILFLVRRHHLLLVTLLLANAVAVEAMPIFLEKITNVVIAIVVSVTAVLLFGEIIPQALCTRYGMAIGYYCAPLVLFLLALFFPITFPIAILLDRILGKDHGTFFRRAELRELVKMHGTHSDENEEPLTYDEVLIVKSALEMRDKTVADAMTPLESVYMLELHGVIDMKVMNELLHQGHSRVPVYNGSKDNVTGLLLVKKLIKLDPDDRTPIQTLEGAHIPPLSCLATMPLYDLLNMFQTQRRHLALVYREEKEDAEPELCGIITLEDVIEELIGEEIVDETDLYVDVHQRVAVARARLQYHRQSISDPGAAPIAATSHPGQFKRRMHRSQSQPFVRLNAPLQPSHAATLEEPPLSSSVPAQVVPKLIPISESPEDVHQSHQDDDLVPLLPDQPSP